MGSIDFSRLKQAFLTPFVGAGGSRWKAAGPGFALAPSSVGEVGGGGKTPVERVSKGFRVRREKQMGERENSKISVLLLLKKLVS